MPLRLETLNVVRDDQGDVPRLRIDLQGNAWITMKDVEAMAIALADPAPQLERRRLREERERDARMTAEANRVREERERAAAEARRADLDRLRKAFPSLADQLVGPEQGTAFYIFVAQGGERAYFPKNGSLVHVSDKRLAARFATKDDALRQVRALEPTAYAIEES